MSVENLIRVAAACAAALAGALAAAALLDFEQFRALAMWLFADDRPHWFERRHHVRGVAALRVFAFATAGGAVVLLAFRRVIARALVALAADAVDAVGMVRRELRDVTIGRTERALTAIVMVAGAALAARNLGLPFRYDEAFTVNAFASRSFFTALTHYDAPNNHVLHTLLVAAAHALGGWNPVVLRLPALLAGCLTLPAVWWFARLEYGRPAAAYGAALVATSPLLLEYAANARGYSLLLLLFVLLLLCARAILGRPDSRALWALYVVLIALGVLTIPVFVFPAAAVVVWMLLVRWRESGAGALPSLLAGMAVWTPAALLLALVLYAPALAVSGFDAVFDNAWVQAMPRGEWAGRVLPDVVVRWSHWHAATPDWAQAALLAAIVVGVTRRPPGGRRGRGWIFAAAAVLGTLAVMLVWPVLLRDRMSLYLLLTSMVVAGAGVACLVETTLAPLRSRRVDAVGHACACLLLLGACAWWATRHGVAAHFASETGYSPQASALVATCIPRHLQPGDYLADSVPTSMVVRFHANRTGLELVRTTVRRGNSAWQADRFGPARADTRGRLFLLVDEEASPTPDVHDYFGGDEYEVVADADCGRVYRLRGLVTASAR